MSIKKDDIVNAIHSDGSDDSYYASSTGSGCVFRFQLDLSFFKPIDTDYKVVPGTFLHQDLIAPNPCYNLIDPTDPSLSHHDKKLYEKVQEQGVPAVGTLAYKSEKVKCLFSGDKHIDLHDLSNTFVLYSHDSNSCDSRAVYLEDGNGWQGPCLWYQENQTTTIDSNLIGSGAWPMGDPRINPPSSIHKTGNGGGTGFHTRYSYDEANNKQNNWKCAVDYIDYNGQNQKYVDANELVKYKEYNPKWNNRYNLDDWWVFLQAWHEAAKAHQDLQYWPDQNKLDSFGWVDNIAAMISLQNGFYWNRDKLGFKREDQTAYEWWGWNEIPFQKERATDADSWDCLAVVLPLNIEHWDYPYTNLKDEQRKYIKKQVHAHENAGYKYGNNHTPSIAIFKQEWIADKYHCINLICEDVISYQDL